MDFGDVIGNLSSFWTQILGVTILLLMYKLGALWHAGGDRLQPSSQTKHIVCGSPNCVRCRAYTANTMETLCKRWADYSQNLLEKEATKVERISRTMAHYQQLGDYSRELQHPTFELLELPTTPFYGRKSFASDVASLETNWREIYSEYVAVRDDPEAWKVNSTPSGQWSAFYFVNQGTEVAKNISRCRKTFEILANLRSFMTGCIFGNACFSVACPGTHITEHYGPCNLRVRCHLGLDVPDGCELLVNGEERQWELGRCLLFDDSYLHSVTHGGCQKKSRPRVVFLVDFWNPDISESERTGLHHLLHSNTLSDDVPEISNKKED